MYEKITNGQTLQQKNQSVTTYHKRSKSVTTWVLATAPGR